MKKKAGLIFALAVLTVSGAIYGFTTKSESDCPLAGTKECPEYQSCAKQGQPDCTIIQNCPLKGTPECPYTKEGDCCAKK